MFNIPEALTFDDVLLSPQYSKILPTNVDVSTKLSEKIKLRIPIMSAAMDTVTESSMAIAMAKAGGIGVVHKNMSPEKQAEIIKQVKEENKEYLVGAAIGHQISDEAGDNAKTRTKMLVDAGVDLIIIDTAHGHSKLVIECAKWFKQAYPDVPLVVGNIATAEAALALAEVGADIVKVGIGPGSICTTRIVSGVGMPALTAIMMVAKALEKTDVAIIADGGMKSSGDITKAIAAGADAVMLGGMLAGTDEAPGEVVTIEGKQYKSYRGMGSLGAVSGGSDERYFQHKRQGKFVSEGVEGSVPYKGSVKNVLYQLIGGLRSGMGYTGSENIVDLQEKAEFIKITNAGSKESHVHDMSFVKETPNYK
jgi:IMP dehydrogenase